MSPPASNNNNQSTKTDSGMAVDVLFVVPVGLKTTEQETLVDIKNIVKKAHGAISGGRNRCETAQFEVDEGIVAKSQKNGTQKMAQAAYEDPLMAVRVSVVCRQNQFTSVRQMAEEFAVAFCSYTGYRVEKQPRMQIVDRDAHYQSCQYRSFHELNVERFALGSFLNFGTYLERVSQMPQVYKPNVRNSRMPNGLQMRQNTTGTEIAPVVVYFEHDRQELAVDFFTKKGCHYRLMIEYDAIDAVLADANQQRGFDLYLVLGQPFKVMEGMHRDKGMSCTPFYAQSDFVRRRGWPIDDVTTHDTQQIVADCNVARIRLCTREALMEVIGRLKCQLNSPIVFAPIKSVEAPNTYAYRKSYFAEDDVHVRNTLGYPEQLSQRALYSLEALFRRGCTLKDQLLLFDRSDPRPETDPYMPFLRLVCRSFKDNATATEEALDQLVDALDDRSRHITVSHVFEWSYNRNSRLRNDVNAPTMSDGGDDDDFLLNSRSDVRKNMLLLPKVVITATRVVPMPPEVLLGNRVLRTYANHEVSPDNFLRVVFKDDNGSALGFARCREGMNKRLEDVEKAEEQLINKRIRSILKNGLLLGKRKYDFLAWSNSQMRESGLYMYSPDPMDRDAPTADGIREWMGVFEDKEGKQLPIPKRMARMGQCFTQGQRTIELEPGDYILESDVLSHSHGIGDGEPFTFSDGVGRISPSCAAKAFAMLPDAKKQSTIPSAFQIRFQGMKGMLCVDPLLDKVPISGRPRLVVFRDSMDKFRCPDEKTLEVVKWSSPVSVTLNRPMIMILDQVSELRGTEVHDRIREHILGTLLERQLRDMADVLVEEEKAAMGLNDRLSTRVDFHELRKRGFSLTTEPFFRSLLLAVFKFNIQCQLQKQHVEISKDQGRTLYGVLDETGRLQYGQVFVQYSTSMNPGGPDRHNSTKILTGPVMVTKNPCVTSGDIRMLEAVDIEPLRHLVDVVVFPRYGPRPHSDEMAGSDLDGDEYSVIWDPKLNFGHHEDAMDYSQQYAGDKDEFENTVNGMCEYFIKYVRGESVGTVANSHLVNADLVGLDHSNCKQLARMHSQAVDFAKTGVPVGRIPGDIKPAKFPDYMEKSHRPTYQSTRLVGEIYRSFQTIASVVNASSDQLVQDEVHCDPQLLLPDLSDDERQDARRDRDAYSHHVQVIIDSYGIENEAALVSGRLISVRNRISDKDRDDYSLFNTDRIIQMRFDRIRNHFRKNFFTEFCNEEDLWPLDANDRPVVKYVTSEKLLNSVYYVPILRKASAWYESVYADSSGGQSRFLSFAWLAWDILAIIKMKSDTMLTALLHDPIKTRLNMQMDKLLERNGSREWRQKIRKVPALKNYCDLYEGLTDVCVVLCKWADREGVFDDSAVAYVHLCLLLVQFGIGDVADTRKKRLMAETVGNEPSAARGRPQIPFREIRAELLIGFLGFLSSRHFRNIKELNFRQFALHCCFRRGEWHSLALVAFKGFYSLSMIGDLKALGLTDEVASSSMAVVEMRPFMIELPEEKDMGGGDAGLTDEKIARFWQQKTKCESVCLSRPSRRRSHGRTARGFAWEVLVSARGTVEALYQLRKHAMDAPDFATVKTAFDCNDEADVNDEEEPNTESADTKRRAIGQLTRRYKLHRILEQIHANTRQRTHDDGGFH